MKTYFPLLVTLAASTFAAALNPFLVLAHLDEAIAQSDPRIIQKINGSYRSAFLRLNPEINISGGLRERWRTVLAAFSDDRIQGIRIVFTRGAVTIRIGNEILVGNRIAGQPDSRVRIYLAEAVAMGPYNAVLEYLIEHRFSGDDVLVLRRALKSRTDKSAAALLGNPDELIEVLQRQADSGIVPMKEGQFRIEELQKLKARNAQIAEH